MNKKDYESVLDNMHLQNNIFWPLPICLYISIEKNNRIEPGTSVAIRNQEGYLFAIMHVEDIWPVDIKKEINYFFEDKNHDNTASSYLNQK